MMLKLLKHVVAFTLIAGVSSAIGQQLSGGGPGGGGGGTPGGSNTQIQFNNAGAFGGTSGITYLGSGQLALALGTITSDLHALTISATWNNAGILFDAPLLVNVTDTASNGNSLLADFNVAASRVAGIQKNGNFFTASGYSFGLGTGNLIDFSAGNMRFFNGSVEVLDVLSTGTVSLLDSKARSFTAGGSAPTATGACAINTQLGGNTAGSFKANGVCSASTVILTFANTAANGWSCDAHDLTTPADLMNQTAYTTTTATFTGTMANLDLVTFKCTAF